MGLRGGHLRFAHHRQCPLHDAHHPESRKRLSVGHGILTSQDLALEVQGPPPAPRALLGFRPRISPDVRIQQGLAASQAQDGRCPDDPTATASRRYQYTQFVLSPDAIAAGLSPPTNADNLARGHRWTLQPRENSLGMPMSRSPIGSGLKTTTCIRVWRGTPKAKRLPFTTELKGAPYAWGSSTCSTGEMELQGTVQNRPGARHGVLRPGRRAHLLMSALEDGQSDLHLYDVVGQQPKSRSGVIGLTICMPAFWPQGSNTFIFASNRPDDTLAQRSTWTIPFQPTLDLFVANLDDDPISARAMDPTRLKWMNAIASSPGPKENLHVLGESCEWTRELEIGCWAGRDSSDCGRRHRSFVTARFHPAP